MEMPVGGLVGDLGEVEPLSGQLLGPGGSGKLGLAGAEDVVDGFALAAFNACPACLRASGSKSPRALRAATSGERLPVIAVRTALSSSTVVAAAAWRSASTTNCSGSAIGLHYDNPCPSTPHQMGSMRCAYSPAEPSRVWVNFPPKVHPWLQEICWFAGERWWTAPAHPHSRLTCECARGKIAEVGPGLRPDGELEIDAGGALVTPGFIEPHTHYDGSLWWDPHIDPMPSHGTTSVVLANCGLGLAPLREADRNQLIELMCFIEDLPTDAFETAIPWTWETWPEYQAANDDHPTALNVAAFFPHQTLRMWVMGADAWERAATAAERAEMARVLGEGLAAGAFGLSTSLMDLDRHNRLVPSRMADDHEWGDLLDVVAAHPGTTFQFVPRAFEFEHFPGDMERMAALCRNRGIRGQLGRLLRPGESGHRAQDLPRPGGSAQRRGR